MRKVSLRMNEELKYQVIKELAHHGGNKLRAAVKLDVTVRTINRYIAAYKSKGKAAFVHGNRHRPPANSLSKEISDLIVSLYREKYDGFNIAHYKDLLSEYENIDVSYALREVDDHAAFSPEFDVPVPLGHYPIRIAIYTSFYYEHGAIPCAYIR